MMNLLNTSLKGLKRFLSNIRKMPVLSINYTSKSPCNLVTGNHFIARFILGAGVAVLCGCAITPATSVKQPMTAKPAHIPPLEARNGGIFNNAAYKPLFEDRRARAVGDIITILITENTSASKQGSSSASKSGSIEASAGTFLGKVIPNSSFAAENSNKYEDKSALNSGNTFSGTLSVTVIEVLANGNVVPSSQVADARIEYRTNSRIDAAQVASILTRFFLSFIPL